VSAEAEFIRRLRAIAPHPAARGLLDDAAVLTPPPGRGIVLSHDMIVEGVHYLATDPPADVAWKLLAVNLSDLAAKGAEPLGVLLGYCLAGADQDTQFIIGLAEALHAFGVPLLGGDTVSVPPGAARSLGLTAIGAAPAAGAPSRGGARAGDALWVSGTIGDAGLGLRIARGELVGPAVLLARYRCPLPRLETGRALAGTVTAMSDISDGLLIDAARMAQASGCGVSIDLDAVPLSAELEGFGSGRAERLAAACAGDDYELLFAAPAGWDEVLLRLCQPYGVMLSRIGYFSEGGGLALRDSEGAVPLPARLGYEHEGRDQG
jgi:thiamine-monophosphate kinase